MRFSTSGSLRRIDVSLLASAIEALRGEWAALRFDAAGALLNPISGAAIGDVRLVEGRHRSPGARYDITIRTPVLEPDPAQLRALDAEHLGREDTDWDTCFDRRQAISVQTGETETTASVVLRADDSRVLAASVTDASQLWSVDVDLVHGRLPRIEATGRLDATAMIAAEQVPGCLARLLGGVATGTATVDLAAIERRGRNTLVEGSGQFNRFRADGAARVTTSARSWDVGAKIRLRGKGIGRLVLRIFGGRLRREFDASMTTGWATAATAMDGIERQLGAVRTFIDQEGGLADVVHRTLWEDGYGDHLDALYSSQHPSE
ncbi:hypothetical protein [Aeromicrobium wangtongii]|uniref:Uncharacterized protein n=1 Tax=Aeromicrobium wangtongii TaxID=2969247 RepID=A0ABY5M681_9ACTN|nr:hypothetical protein [Aeromicrobium wangtongii]MCD9199304.1 hypothetical protein [Aeromicrobium wangtongii]UUP13665.1 hypothetical protein NQV15_17720 [Aeromicrobium wangtongii]